MTAFSDETGRGVLESQQHVVEGIILRRLHDKRIEGYTLEMSKEIVSALSAYPVAQEPVAKMTFTRAMDIAERGFKTWRSKPHNAKWFKRIDGTPIPNDLLVNIAEAFCHDEA